MTPSAIPLVMIPGGCHIGKLYDETPDGREGWRTHGLRRGYAVYVMDPPRRGRSTFDPATILEVRRGHLPPGALPDLTTLTAETAWPMNRIGPTFGDAHPGVQFPVEHFDQYLAQMAPDWDLPQLRSDAQAAAVIALLEQIGPSVLFTHSATVTVGWMVVRRRPDLVRAHVAVEGGGGPIDDLSPSGGAEKGDDDPGLDAALEAYAAVPALTVLGDFLELDSLWKLFASSSRRFSALVAAHGGMADVLDLPGVGITGNTHVPMIDRNSAQVCDRILDWIETHVAATHAVST